MLYFARFALTLSYTRRYSHSEKSKFIWFFSRLIVMLTSSNLGGASEIKINSDLFCISLGLH